MTRLSCAFPLLHSQQTKAREKAKCKKRNRIWKDKGKILKWMIWVVKMKAKQKLTAPILTNHWVPLSKLRSSINQSLSAVEQAASSTHQSDGPIDWPCQMHHRSDKRKQSLLSSVDWDRWQQTRGKFSIFSSIFI